MLLLIELTNLLMLMKYRARSFRIQMQQTKELYKQKNEEKAMFDF